MNQQVSFTGDVRDTDPSSRVGYVYSEKFMFWNQGGYFTGHEPSTLEGVSVVSHLLSHN